MYMDMIGSAEAPLAAFLTLCACCSWFLLRTLLLEWRRFGSMVCTAKQDKNLGRWHVSFVGYMRYRFALWYTWHEEAQLLILLALTLFALLFGGCLGRLMTDKTMSASVWAAWVWLIQPDGGSGEEGAMGRVVGMVVSLVGLLVFALTVSMVSENFRSWLEELKMGRSAVVESGHIVILGWNNAALSLLEELCIAGEASGGSMIVLLVSGSKPEIESIIQNAGIDFRGSHICVRSGKAHVANDLHKVSCSTARTLLLLTSDEDPREERDASTLRSLIVIYEQSRIDGQTVVIQCCLARNQEMFEDFGGRSVEVVVADDFVAGILVQCSSRHGLASVFNSLFSFNGDETYVHRVPDLAGRSFGSVLFSMPETIPLGVISATNGMMLLPPLDYVFSPTDDVICLAEDDCMPRVLAASDAEASFQRSALTPDDLSTRLGRRKRFDSIEYDGRRDSLRGDKLWNPQPERDSQRERDSQQAWGAKLFGSLAKVLSRRSKKSSFGVQPDPNSFISDGALSGVTEATQAANLHLILGFNDMATTLLTELDKIAPPKSEVLVFSPVPIDTRTDMIKLECRRRGRSFRNIIVSHRQGRLGDRLHLEELPLGRVQAMYVLADETAANAEEADGRVLSLLVQLQHVLLGLQLHSYPSILVETYCRETDEQCLFAGIKDFVGVQRLTSRILAGVCWQPAVNKVYNMFLSGSACRFNITPLPLYLPDRDGYYGGTLDDEDAESVLPHSVSFEEVTALVLKFGEIAIGWTSSGCAETVTWSRKDHAAAARQSGLGHLRTRDLAEIWEINPKDKKAQRPWTKKDRVVVLQVHQTASE